MTTLKLLTVWITTNWKILKEMGLLDHLTCLLRNLYSDQEATVRTDMEQHTGSKLGNGYVKVGYCHSANLTFLQRISCEMLGWMKHKLESKFLGEIPITSDTGFPGGSEVKTSASNVGDPGLIPGSGRSPGEGNGNPFQYSCLENPMDGGI